MYRTVPIVSYLFIVLLGSHTLSAQSSGPIADRPACLPCDSLLSLRLADVTIREVASLSEPVPHCQVLGTISKEINFELLLPSAWNGRFAMGGGGGFVGSIQNMAKSSLAAGYATSGTDTGHKGPGLKADWAYHHMERQINFGRLAIHRTAVVSKAIISKHYCAYPDYSYFMGCSRGGGQAMIEAQYYPQDFDGIVAAAPILDWPATAAEFIQNVQALYPDPDQLDETLLSPEEIALFQAAVFEQCDALDGVADQMLADPRDCKMDFDLLPRCDVTDDTEQCFTDEELAVIRTILSGPSDATGPIYPGFPLGCEDEPGGWKAWITGPNPGTMSLGFPSLHFGFGTEVFKYLVYQDPDWDYTTYDFADWRQETAYASSYLNATSTDYSAFKEREGKLLIFHGWNDHALSALTMIEHYEAAQAVDPDLADYARLFLLPGVLHCGGGTGPSEANWIEIVRQWVEEGVVPDRIVVSKTVDDVVELTRPVFPYPARAKYDGKGDPNEETSFLRDPAKN